MIGIKVVWSGGYGPGPRNYQLPEDQGEMLKTLVGLVLQKRSYCESVVLTDSVLHFIW